MHEQPLNMQTLTKNPWSQAENFFFQSKLLVFTKLLRVWTVL